MTEHNQPFDLNQLNNLLQYIPSDTDRTEWVTNLMAIKSEFLEDGRETAQNWSSTAPNYNIKSFINTWKSIKANGGVTIATLVKKAIDNGFKFEPISNDKRQQLTRESQQRKAYAEQQEREQRARQAQQHKQASQTANHIILNAKPASLCHEYLQRKNINPYGVLFGSVLSYKDNLIIPVYGTKCPYIGLVQSLQFIAPNGDKRFMKQGKKAGGYYPIQWIDNAPIIICEGFATGATLAEHYAPFSCVICAFDSGNLEAVAKWFRKSYPTIQIIIAGDNDHRSPTNTGKQKAEQVAGLIGGLVSIPQFTHDENGTDWNDRYNLDQQYKKQQGGDK